MRSWTWTRAADTPLCFLVMSLVPAQMQLLLGRTCWLSEAWELKPWAPPASSGDRGPAPFSLASPRSPTDRRPWRGPVPEQAARLLQDLSQGWSFWPLGAELGLLFRAGGATAASRSRWGWAPPPRFPRLCMQRHGWPSSARVPRPPRAQAL